MGGEGLLLFFPEREDVSWMCDVRSAFDVWLCVMGLRGTCRIWLFLCAQRIVIDA